MPVFHRLGRILLLLLVGLSVLGLPPAAAAPLVIPHPAPPAGPGPIHIAGVDAPPGCTFSNYFGSRSASQPIVDHLPITSTVHVSGVSQPIWEMTVQTNISHTFSGDLVVFLISPGGVSTTLTTRNGGGSDDLFASTVWSDRATIGVAEADLATDGLRPQLIPEGAMGAFRGLDANGDWQLVVTDVDPGEGGSFNGWTLSFNTLNEHDRSEFYLNYNGADEYITDHNTVTSTLTYSGLGSYLVGLTAYTAISHTAPVDLIVTLTAPNGLTTTLTQGNGGSNDNQFYDTSWSDSAPLPVSDATYVSGVPLAEVQPEGAMSHFVGSDPNGTWTLSISDVLTLDVGVLEEWGLAVTSGYCTPVRLPLVTR